MFCTVRDGLAELDLLGCGRALTMRIREVLILRSPPQAGVSKDGRGKIASPGIPPRRTTAPTLERQLTVPIVHYLDGKARPNFGAEAITL